MLAKALQIVQQTEQHNFWKNPLVSETLKRALYSYSAMADTTFFFIWTIRKPSDYWVF